jgi:hypothetical protein
MDAWVAVLGAPVAAHSSPVALNRKSLQEQAVAPAATVQVAGTSQTYKYKKGGAAPWSNDTAYQHSVVLGNDGQPLQRLVERRPPQQHGMD